METIPITEAKARIAELADRVAREHDHFTITRNGRADVMLISVAEYESMKETLDILSDEETLADLRQSREDFGYVREEFAATGVPMAGRGDRVADYIRAMRALWSMPSPEYEGQFVSFRGIDAHPRPVQRPGPPVVIGGEATAALRRAVTMANGWYGFGLDLAGTRQCTDQLRKLAEQHERPAELGPLELTVTPVGTLDKATVSQYAELGIDRLVLLPEPDADRSRRHAPVPADRIMRNIDNVAERFLR